MRETIEAAVERQHARTSKRTSSKIISQISNASSTQHGRSTSVATSGSPVPSLSSVASSKHRYSHSASGVAAGEASLVGANGGLPGGGSQAGRTSLSSSLRSSFDGPVLSTSVEPAAGLGVINESRSSVSYPVHSRVPSATVPPSSANNRISVESTLSNISTSISGRKSTSSTRSNVLGFDPMGKMDKAKPKYEQSAGMDEFEMLLKGSGTKKMSLTPVVMKRSEVRLPVFIAES